MTIYRLTSRRYRPATARAALPGWTAAEIHAALTERVPSSRTDRVLEPVARALGAREGTRPDDTPLIRSLNEQAYAAGHSAELVAAVPQHPPCARHPTAGAAGGRARSVRRRLAR